jgi:hypothetical protein
MNQSSISLGYTTAMLMIMNYGYLANKKVYLKLGGIMLASFWIARVASDFVVQRKKESNAIDNGTTVDATSRNIQDGQLQ